MNNPPARSWPNGTFNEEIASRIAATGMYYVHLSLSLNILISISKPRLDWSWWFLHFIVTINFNANILDVSIISTNIINVNIINVSIISININTINVNINTNINIISVNVNIINIIIINKLSQNSSRCDRWGSYRGSISASSGLWLCRVRHTSQTQKDIEILS